MRSVAILVPAVPSRRGFDFAPEMLVLVVNDAHVGGFGLVQAAEALVGQANGALVEELGLAAEMVILEVPICASLSEDFAMGVLSPWLEVLSHRSAKHILGSPETSNCGTYTVWLLFIEKGCGEKKRSVSRSYLREGVGPVLEAGLFLEVGVGMKVEVDLRDEVGLPVRLSLKVNDSLSV